MEVDMLDAGTGPPPEPTLEEELVNNFGSEILHNSPRTPPGEEDIPDEGTEYDEDDNMDGAGSAEYSDEFLGAMDLTQTGRHRVSDSEGEGDENPLRTIINRRVQVLLVSLVTKACLSLKPRTWV
jgi:hypothetical protein